MTIEPGSIIEMTEAEIYALNKKAANDYDLLIKAAPDLLDTLVLALPYVECAEDDPTYKPGAVAKVVKKIHAAIAKATGEQQ